MMNELIVLIVCITLYHVVKLIANHSDDSRPSHIHEWELLSKTYEPGLDIRNVNARGVGEEELQRIFQHTKGQTSFMFQCSDDECRELRTETMYGKETE